MSEPETVINQNKGLMSQAIFVLLQIAAISFIVLVIFFIWFAIAYTASAVARML